jgi:ATP-dependent 26S proteasome regulatory subunit
MSSGMDEERQHALASFKAKLLESREWEAKLKALRLEIKGLQKDFDHTEDNIKALQSVGQIIGEVLKQLDDERCEHPNPSCAPPFADRATTSYRQGLIWS